jgi:hypothetical protein
MRTPGLFWLVVLVVPPIVALFALPPFGQRIVILVGIYALMGLGYQLIFGQLGALNLAQGASLGAFLDSLPSILAVSDLRALTAAENAHEAANGEGDE